MKLLALLVLAVASAVFAAPAHVISVAARHVDQNVPSTSDDNFIRTVMNAHWFWRRMHCAQELVWDPNLAQLALESVNSCSRTIQHDRAGSNLSGVSPAPSKYDDWITMARDCIHGWHEEEPKYPYGNPQISEHAGYLHFTQMVWRDTTRIGCAMGNCGDKTSSSPARIYCFYEAMGNNIAAGEFEKNVWPPVCYAPSRLEAEARFGY
ncbi:PR-1-like protein [Periconia macrospinosa]|uniref:PR-1-like protein n=1 Tax=Periconia macrospinosa TaxID=97972 RepID=A0A2V1E4E7_9PLEO|nr:PR-1-like protein [Periconia macrospinosa]